MASFIIEGGNKLSGCMEAGGSKNAVLPILSAAVLVEGISILENVPDLKDVDLTLSILKSIGCRVERSKKTVTVDASDITGSNVASGLPGEIRSSITLLGALLGRCGEVSISYPGGSVTRLSNCIL